MPYCEHLDFNDITYLKLFDDIPYKDVKNVIPKNEYDWNDFQLAVSIEPMDASASWLRKTKFTFQITNDVSCYAEEPYEEEIKNYVVFKEYDTTSFVAKYIENNLEVPPCCYANGKYSAPIPCGCSQPCCVPDSDDEEEKPKCKSCGVERVVDYEDNICHTCYHKSCDEGECYCCDNEEKPKEEEKPKIVIIKKKKKKAKKLIIKA